MRTRKMVDGRVKRTQKGRQKERNKVKHVTKNE
jgi:hypothetical protein